MKRSDLRGIRGRPDPGPNPLEAEIGLPPDPLAVVRSNACPRRSQHVQVAVHLPIKAQVECEVRRTYVRAVQSQGDIQG